MSKHNLMQYGLAKDAIKDLPEIQRTLDSFYKELYKHREYFAANFVLDAIIESQAFVKRQYKEAKQVVADKGKV